MSSNVITQDLTNPDGNTTKSVDIWHRKISRRAFPVVMSALVAACSSSENLSTQETLAFSLKKLTKTRDPHAVNSDEEYKQLCDTFKKLGVFPDKDGNVLIVKEQLKTKGVNIYYIDINEKDALTSKSGDLNHVEDMVVEIEGIKRYIGGEIVYPKTIAKPIVVTR